MTMGGCKEMLFFESCFIAACAGMMYLFVKKIKDDVMMMKMRCRMRVVDEMQ